MFPFVSVTHRNNNPVNKDTKPENHKKLQEKSITGNLDILAGCISGELENLDNDCCETIELRLFGLQIFVDVATRGWNYRSIELLAVDIMNDKGDALNNAARQLYNILEERIVKMNAAMDKIHDEKNYEY